jgi:homogentisate 1,2-dioxygenase
MEITLLSQGVIYQIDFDTAQSIAVCRIIRAYLYAKTIKNESGQHLEHAPFCERDFILPTSWRLMMKRAIFLSKLKEGMMHEVVYASHPLM